MYDRDFFWTHEQTTEAYSKGINTTENQVLKIIFVLDSLAHYTYTNLIVGILWQVPHSLSERKKLIENHRN